MNMNALAPPKQKRAPAVSALPKLRLRQSNSGVAIAQYVCGPRIAAHRARELELLCFATRSLAEIRTTLAELTVLSQQTNDVLRRLLVTKFSNFAHVEQNSAKASGSSALQPNGRN